MRSATLLRSRRALAVGTLAAALLVVALASLMLGSNLISPVAVLTALFDPAQDTGAVVWGSRVPRTVLGVLVGVCLGIAGAVMQGQTRNPLADPGLFGVSAEQAGVGERVAGLPLHGSAGDPEGDADEDAEAHTRHPQAPGADGAGVLGRRGGEDGRGRKMRLLPKGTMRRG